MVSYWHLQELCLCRHREEDRRLTMRGVSGDPEDARVYLRTIEVASLNTGVSDKVIRMKALIALMPQLR